MTSLHSTSGRKGLGFVLAVLAMFLWGVLPLALVIVLKNLDIYTVTWFRFSLSFCFLTLYLGARQQLPNWAKLRQISWGLLGGAIVFLIGNYLLFVQGLTMTSPGTAEVLIQIAPVLLGLGGIVVFKEPYTSRQWFGLGLLICGLILFSQEKLQTVLVSVTTYWLGSGIVVLGAVSWAIYALAQKQLLQQLSSAHILLLIYGGCSLLIAPVININSLANLTPLEWILLIFCGFNTVIAYGSFAESLEHWEASKVSAVLSLAPLVTLGGVEVIAWLFPTFMASEKLTFLAVIGAVFVVLGCIIVSLGKKTNGIVVVNKNGT